MTVQICEIFMWTVMSGMTIFYVLFISETEMFK